MDTKKNLVLKLDNIKIVIGNGFDLHCKLKSSYSDYFKSKENDFNYISKLFERISNTIYTNGKSFSVISHTIQEDIFENLTLWDFLFYFNSITTDESIDEWRWCDVESSIQDWLSYEQINDSSLNLNTVYNLLTDEYDNSTLDDENVDIFLLICAVIYKKNNYKIFGNKYDYYNFVLKELKLFEKNLQHI